jgi:hypothetical protein
VPGGEPVKDDVESKGVHANDRIEFVESLRAFEQKNTEFNVGRVAVYGVAAPFAIAGLVVFSE